MQGSVYAFIRKREVANNDWFNFPFCILYHSVTSYNIQFAQLTLFLISIAIPTITSTGSAIWRSPPITAIRIIAGRKNKNRKNFAMPHVALKANPKIFPVNASAKIKKNNVNISGSSFQWFCLLIVLF